MFKKCTDKILIKTTNNRNKYIMVSIILLVGIVSGAVFGSKNAASDSGYFSNFISAYKIHGAAEHEIFINAIASNLRAMVFVWLSGWCLLLIPINFIQIISKGFGLGYTIAYLIAVSGFKGFLFAVSSLLLQNLILIPAILMLSVYELNFATAFTARNLPIKQKRRMITNNLIVLIVVILVALISSFIDSHISPFFIKIILGNII